MHTLLPSPCMYMRELQGTRKHTCKYISHAWSVCRQRSKKTEREERDAKTKCAFFVDVYAHNASFEAVANLI